MLVWVCMIPGFCNIISSDTHCQTFLYFPLDMTPTHFHPSFHFCLSHSRFIRHTGNLTFCLCLKEKKKPHYYWTLISPFLNPSECNQMIPGVLLIPLLSDTFTYQSLAQVMVCSCWMGRSGSSIGGCWLQPSTMTSSNPMSKSWRTLSI